MDIINTKDNKNKFMNYLIFGGNKTGKTRLATTVEGLLFINVEDNVSTLYGADINMVNAFSYNVIDSIITELEAMNNLPKWIFLDSITDLSFKILEEELPNYKDGRQAYMIVGQKIRSIIVRLKSLQTNFVALGQQGYIKDELTGGLIFGCAMAGQKLESSLPYLFNSVLCTKTMPNKDGELCYALQCQPTNDLQIGSRTTYDSNTVLDMFEKPDLLLLNNKILNNQIEEN